jgi:hypothetical protein
LKSYKLNLYTDKCDFTKFHNLINDTYELEEQEVYRGEDPNDQSSLINPIQLLSPEIINDSEMSIQSQKMISHLESVRINTEIKTVLLRYINSYLVILKRRKISKNLKLTKFTKRLRQRERLQINIKKISL